jgi:hypothetical protein
MLLQEPRGLWCGWGSSRDWGGVPLGAGGQDEPRAACCIPRSYAHALDGLYRVAREGERTGLRGRACGRGDTGQWG